MPGPEKVFNNPETGAVVQTFSPIRVFFYDHSAYPYNLLNPLAKAVLYEDSRFEGGYLFEHSFDPDAADFLVFPCDLNYFEKREDEVLELLDFYSGNEARHVFFDRRDHGEPLSPRTAIHLRASVERKDLSPSLICIPYLEPIDNFFSYLRRPREIRYDLCFIGERTQFRERLLCGLQDVVGSVYFRLRNDFFFGTYMANAAALNGMKSTVEVARAQREEYIDVMRSSRFCLAPKGFGANSFRFYEALSLGVPPILVSDDCALPFEDLVNYDEICLRFDAREPDVALQIQEAIQGMLHSRYERLCRMGRLYFDAYLSCRNFLFLLYDNLDKLMASPSIANAR